MNTFNNEAWKGEGQPLLVLYADRQGIVDSFWVQTVCHGQERPGLFLCILQKLVHYRCSGDTSEFGWRLRFLAGILQPECRLCASSMDQSSEQLYLYDHRELCSWFNGWLRRRNTVKCSDWLWNCEWNLCFMVLWPPDHINVGTPYNMDVYLPFIRPCFLLLHSPGPGIIQLAAEPPGLVPWLSFGLTSRELSGFSKFRHGMELPIQVSLLKLQWWRRCYNDANYFMVQVIKFLQADGLPSFSYQQAHLRMHQHQPSRQCSSNWIPDGFL